MQEHDEMNDHESKLETTSTGTNRWLAVAVAALLIVAGIALTYGYRQQTLADHLTSQQTVADATISQMQGQLNSVTSKLNDMTAAQQAQAEAQAQAAKQAEQKTVAGTTRTGAHRSPATDKRYKQLQAQLADQQKQLKDTQDQVAKNRTDLEGNISSTRDELNGSIARTHEELVVLQKRGERNFTEFDLMKAKQFQRIGPLTLSLRKADTKHKNYDIEMIVDDNQLTKKKVNLYEPIWIHTENESQPVQVVVMRIEKNLVHGYVSAPKYRPSELATSGTPGTLTPVSTHVTPDSSQPQPSTTPPPQQ
jgi:hypothetical protein